MKKTIQPRDRGIGAWTALLMLISAQSLPLSAMAAGPIPTNAPVHSATASATVKSSSFTNILHNLNLSSTKATVAASKSGTITVGGHVGVTGIVVGGTAVPISLGKLLTPAENA